MDYKYSFNTDPAGPKGISINSWLDPDKLALIIIDVQNYLTNKKFSGQYSSSNHENYYARFEDVILPNIKRAINIFKKFNLQIIYTRNAAINKFLFDVPGLSRIRYAEELKDIRGKNYHLYEDDFTSKIDDRILPGEKDIILLKTSSGAFCSSNIDLVLRNNNLTSLVFTGGLTDACISTSVREASDRGYLCTVLDDACICSNIEDHKAALKSLEKYFAWVTTTEDFILKLTSTYKSKKS